MKRGLNGRARRSLRRNLAVADRQPIDMQVIVDVSPLIDEIYTLYLAVCERSTLRFEKLTKEYFCRIGALMPDRTRFFIWRKDGKIAAFSLCMLDSDGVWAEYLGLDYAVALDIHLYFRAYRDVVTWAIANGYKRFHGTGLHYDPKHQLGHLLEPLDLYVRHTSWLPKVLLRWALPLLDPTRYDDAAEVSQLQRTLSDRKSILAGRVVDGIYLPVASLGESFAPLRHKDKSRPMFNGPID